MSQVKVLGQMWKGDKKPKGGATKGKTSKASKGPKQPRNAGQHPLDVLNPDVWPGFHCLVDVIRASFQLAQAGGLISSSISHLTIRNRGPPPSKWTPDRWRGSPMSWVVQGGEGEVRNVPSAVDEAIRATVSRIAERMRIQFGVCVYPPMI